MDFAVTTMHAPLKESLVESSDAEPDLLCPMCDYNLRGRTSLILRPLVLESRTTKIRNQGAAVQKDYALHDRQV